MKNFLYSIIANSTSYILQDVDERSDEQTKEEIAKLKAQLEAAKQKLAQREAEAEYARKNPYTIVPGGHFDLASPFVF